MTSTIHVTSVDERLVAAARAAGLHEVRQDMGTLDP